jgi:hypothetical protein
MKTYKQATRARRASLQIIGADRYWSEDGPWIYS